MEVIGCLEIGELWAPSVEADTDIYDEFLDAVEAAGLQIDTASAGEKIIVATEPEYTASILSPEDDLESDDLNDYSVVILVEYGETSFLFTGDAPVEILEGCIEDEIDVLKVSHHGSETGTDESLAESLSPKISVISYEEGNSYGHPDQEVIDALKAVDSDVYGTGVHGTIIVYSDGSELTVERESYGKVQAGTTEEETVEDAESETAEETEAAASSSNSEVATSSEDSGTGTSSSDASDSNSSSNSSGSSSSDEASSSSSSSSSGSSSSSSSSSSSESTDSTTYVYIATNSGTKYHKTASCRGLSNSTSTTQVTLEYALNHGYEACKICY